jgi:hypothetical protein
MLDTQSLFFPRADQLGDPFEGSYPKRDIQHPDRLYCDPQVYKAWCQYHAISCWHKNNAESDGMWKIYSDKQKGIAIQSTYNRLERCCADTAYDTWVTPVRYINYETKSFPDQELHQPFQHKRIFFKHENEIRAIARKFPPPAYIKDGLPEPGLPSQEYALPFPGVSIDADLIKLIEVVYVSPDSDKHFIDLVISLMKRYNLSMIPVKPSALSGDPVW